jgi:hypothetical protein
VAAVAMTIRSLPQVTKLTDAAMSLVKRVQQQLHAQHASVALELCMKTFRKTGQARVHLHAAFSKANGRMDLRNPHSLTFMDSPPSDVQHPAGRGHNYRSQMNRMHFYCQVAKTGSLWLHTNYPYGANFQVDPRWVQSLWEMDKLSYEEAREQFILCKRNVQKMLENMSSWKKHHEMFLLEQQRRQAMTVLFSSNKQWRTIPAVEEWKEQWQDTLRGRRKFLVMEGPSSIGKSFFCLSICGIDKTFHVDCTKGGEPDMRDYDFFKHEAIFFDECTPAQVLSQKILFMGSPLKVKMEGSSTNI